MELHKKYKDFSLKVEIDNIENKSLVIFSGASGSGKTTAINEIYYNHFKNLKKTFMESTTKLLSSIKVKDLISLSRKDKDFKSSYYDLLHIDELLELNANKLSKGEQRRLYFYMCISSKSDMYYLDEPFSFLDKNMQMIVKNIIEDIAKEKIVIVATHHDIFDCKRITYKLDKGLLLDKKIYESIKEELSIEDNYIDIKNNKNNIFLKHNILIASNIIIFTIFITIFSIMISGFNSVQSLKLSLDTLGIFNSQNGVIIEPEKINVSKEKSIEIYNRIAKEENIEIIENYSFSENIYFDVDNNRYLINELYSYKKEITDDKFYSSYYNPFLISYFKQIYPNKTNVDIINDIKNYNYLDNPILLNISGSLYGVEYNKDIVISGVMDSNYYFNSNISVIDFYKLLNNEIYEINSGNTYSEGDPVLIKYIGLKSNDTSGEYLKYLSYKYNEFEYILDDKGYIIISNNKNISIESYQNYISKNDSVFSYSFGDDLFCLKSIEFFKNNNFSYIGELTQESGSIIVSKNYAIRYFNDSFLDNLIGKNIKICDKVWKINCILDGVSDDNIYFCYNDYLNYITPLYSYRVEVLICDYLNSDSIIDELNNNEIGFNARLDIKNNVDYTEHLINLQNSKDNLLELRVSFVILSIIIIGMLVIFSLLLIINSYKLYTTLNSLYINVLLRKIFTIIFCMILCCIIVLLTSNILTEIIKSLIFERINQSLSAFPISAKEIKIEYNWNYILLSFIVLLIGELFNGKKVEYFFKRIFKKV